ncbi:MAG: LEA type 2 family protein [Chitinophagales bacterium]|nr:LEA type 2 family protein [Chitinophagales bacterium]
MKKYLLPLFLIFLAACSTEAVKPKFKTIQNIVVEDLNYTNITINADAVVFNPNPVSIYLNNVDVDIFVNEVLVSHVSQTAKTEIKKKDNFNIPLKTSFTPKQLLKDNWAGLLSGALNSLQNKQVDVKYTGSATFDVKGIEFSIPIDGTEEIILKEGEVQ